MLVISAPLIKSGPFVENIVWLDGNIEEQYCSRNLMLKLDERKLPEIK